MAKTTTNQYRPISTSETSTDDGLSVRYCRDLAWAMNNYRFHAGNHKLVSQMFYPYEPSLDDTNNNLILYLGKWFVPNGVRQVRWWLRGRITSGTDATTWTLVSATNFYVGAQVFDSTKLWDYTTSTVDITSTGWEPLNNTMQLCRADFNGYIWLYLLAENDTGDSDPSTRSEIVSLDVQPLVS